MIIIGDTPVLLTDWGGALDRHIEHHHSLDLMRAFSKAAPVHIPRGKNLLCPNYPKLPDLKLNQLVVPTGATRWSYGLFLVTTAQKDIILAESAASQNKLAVTYGAPASWKEVGVGEDAIFKPDLVLTMSPLPPRPITPSELSGLEDTNIQSLWILPMVDQRYFWQFKNIDKIEDEIFEDVNNLIDYISGRLGTVLVKSGTIAQLNVPDVSASNNYENAAVLLETIAWHTGCQVVPLLDSTGGGYGGETAFCLCTVDDSATVYSNNAIGLCGISTGGFGFEIAGQPLVDSGGEMAEVQGSAFLPEKIQLPATGDFVSATAASAGFTGGTIPSSSAVLRLKWEGIDPPDNYMAVQAAKDYYGRFKKCYEYTFSGVQKWQPSAYDDCVIFMQTRFNEGYRCQTRVRSWHHNLLPETIAAVADGGSHHIEFTIMDVFCPDDEDNEEGVLYVLADWLTYTGGCSVDPPGVDEYTGLIKIYDTCVLGFYTSEDLIGKTGYATYLYPKAEPTMIDRVGDVIPFECIPKWKALSICGEPECA